jgi:hypothetical protein
MHNSRRNQPQLSAPCFHKKLKIGSGRVNETCQQSGIINYSWVPNSLHGSSIDENAIKLICTWSQRFFPSEQSAKYGSQPIFESERILLFFL